MAKQAPPRKTRDALSDADLPWSSSARQHQRQLKEEALFETAARWFNRHGFHGTSLSDLATELGITKAALYHYVRDKSELLYRLHLRSLDAAEASRRRAVEEGGNGLDCLQLIVRYYVTSITSSPTFTFVLLEDGALTSEQSKEILKRRIWLERDLREVVAKGIQDGSITPCDPKFVALMVGGAMNSVAKWFRSDGPWEGACVAHELSQMLGRMVAVASNDFPLSRDIGLPAPDDIR
jgi:TetR/AcrR family transcriptional regulator